MTIPYGFDNPEISFLLGTDEYESVVALMEDGYELDMQAYIGEHYIHATFKTPKLPNCEVTFWCPLNRKRVEIYIRKNEDIIYRFDIQSRVYDKVYSLKRRLFYPHLYIKYGKCLINQVPFNLGYPKNIMVEPITPSFYFEFGYPYGMRMLESLNLRGRGKCFLGRKLTNKEDK